MFFIAEWPKIQPCQMLNATSKTLFFLKKQCFTDKTLHYVSHSHIFKLKNLIKVDKF